MPPEITARIGNTLNLELIAAEAVRPTERPDALDYILRGRAARLRPNSRDSLAEAISLFEHALAADPGSSEAQSRLATSLVDRVLDFGSSSAEADIKRAEELATKAVAASPRSAIAHHVKGQVLRAQRRCAEAIPEYETALGLNRNLVGAFASIGRCKIYIGPIEEAIPAQEQAIRLSPRDPKLRFGIGGSAKRICCNLTSMRRSFGSKSRAAPMRDYLSPTLTSQPPTPSDM